MIAAPSTLLWAIGEFEEVGMYTIERRSTDHFDVRWFPASSMSGLYYPRMVGHISKRGTMFVAECGPVTVGTYSKRNWAFGAIKHYDQTGEKLPNR